MGGIAFPEPDHRKLAQSPIELVVCQVRYEPTMTPIKPDDALAFREVAQADGWTYPHLEQIVERGVEARVGAEGAGITTSQQQTGWRLRSDDRTWAVSAVTTSTSIETTAYETWEDDFRLRLAATLRACDKVLGPKVVQRFGLRYVNRISEPKVQSAIGWDGVIQAPLLGALRGHVLSEGIRTTQQQMDLQIDADISAILRHGTFPEDTRERLYNYVVDIDVYRARSESFDVEGLVALADDFNVQALKIWQAAMESDYLDTLGRT